MRNLIIAAAMIIPVLATGALAATTHTHMQMRAMGAVSAPVNQSMADETCTFEPTTGTWGHCDNDPRFDSAGNRGGRSGRR